MSDHINNSQLFNTINLEKDDIKNNNEPVYVKKIIDEFSRVQLITNSVFLSKVLRSVNEELGEYYMPRTKGFTIEVFKKMCNNLENEKSNAIPLLHRELCIIGKNLLSDNCPVTHDVLVEIEPYITKILDYPILFKSRKLLIEIFSVATSYRGNYKHYKIKSNEFIRTLQYNVLLFDFGRVQLFCKNNVGLPSNQKVTTVDEFEFRLTITKLLENFAPDFDLTTIPLENEIINNFMAFVVQVVKSFFRLIKNYLNNEHTKVKHFSDKFFYTHSLFDICYETLVKLIDCEMLDEPIIFNCGGIREGLNIIGKDAYEFFCNIKITRLLVINGLNKHMKTFFDMLIQLQLQICEIPSSADQCSMFIKQIYFWKEVVGIMIEIEKAPQINSNGSLRVSIKPLDGYYRKFIDFYKIFSIFEEEWDSSTESIVYSQFDSISDNDSYE